MIFLKVWNDVYILDIQRYSLIEEMNIKKQILVSNFYNKKRGKPFSSKSLKLFKYLEDLEQLMC